MKKIRVVVCDDRPEELMRYTSLCREICKKHKIDIEIKGYESGDILLTYLDDPKYFTKVDIILLDINMPGTNGIEAARQIREYGYQGVILFITVSENKEHFRKAFSVKAANYHIKGEDSPELFEEMFLDTVKIVEESNSRVITLYGGGEQKQFEIKRILYFEALKRIVNVCYTDKFGKEQIFECIITLAELENNLADMPFMRIHKGYLLNMLHVKSFSHNEVVLESGKTLPIGRKYTQEVRREIPKTKVV